MFFDPEHTQSTGEFESGGSFENIPKGTELLAYIDQAGWEDKEANQYGGAERFVSLRWTCHAPEQYKNRKIFQKLYVLSSDAEKAKKAKAMLAAIDTNAGGKLKAANTMPTNESLTLGLVNKLMMIKVGIWKGDTGTGNFISAVAPRKQVVQPAAPAVPPPPSFDDDIPF